MNILSLKNVIKVYPPNIRAVNNLSFDLHENESLTILGCSLSGKTTLSRLICGMEKPNDGEIIFLDKPMPYNEKQTAKIRNKYIGILSRQSELIDHISVLDNVALPLVLQDIKKEDRYLRAIKLLKTLGVKNYNCLPKGLRTYERNLIKLARAVITNPKLIIIDEFFADCGLKELEIMKDYLNTSNHAMIILTDDTNLPVETNKTVQLKNGHFLEEI